MTRVQAASVAGLLIAAVAVTFIIQRQSQVRLRRENASLLEQASRLTATNAALSNVVAQADSAGSPAGNELQELLNLRAEVARLRADSLELAQSNAAARMNDPTNRVAFLKQRLDEMPDKKIPELALLNEQNWRITAPATLETDDDLRAAFSRLREIAKQIFVRQLGLALHRYAEAHDGRLPDDLSELKPYFTVSVDDAVFQRYELKQTGKLSDVPQVGTYPPASAGSAARADLAGASMSAQKPALPWTEPVVVEKAPVDDKYDTLFTVTAYGYSYRRFDRGGTGTGSGTWARIGTNGLPELILPRQ